MVCRRAMDKLPRHVEECDRVYPIRYIDRHHRTYKKTYHEFTSMKSNTF